MNSTMENYETLYKEVCRICLSLDRDNDQMIPLLENYKLSCYGQDIETITQTCVENVKGPPNMCQHCLNQLNETKQFIQKCKTSQNYFENIKNCSEYYRKKIVVDTVLAHIKEYGDSTEPAETLIPINEMTETANIDVKPKLFEIRIEPFKEIDNALKDGLSDSNTLIRALNIKSENDLKIPLNQYKELYHKAKTKSRSAYEVLDSLKLNTNIKIETISNCNLKSTENKTFFKPKLDLKLTPTKIKKEPVRKLSEPVWKLNEPVRKLNEPVQKLNEPVRKLTKPVEKSDKPVKLRQDRGEYEKYKNADGRYECNICQKTAKTRSSLISHFARHARNIVCHHCGKAFATKAEINLHLFNKHGELSTRHFKCSECDFKCGVKFELEQHKSVHTGERPFVCDQCGLDFRTQFVFKNHLLVHMEKKVQCPKCPLKFRNRSQLSVHDNNVHERRHMYPCPRCGRLYARNKSVRKHLASFHGVSRHMQGKIPLIKVKDSAQPTTHASFCANEDGPPSGCEPEATKT